VQFKLNYSGKPSFLNSLTVTLSGDLLRALLYKEDWERVSETYEAWWEGELNRPLIYLTYIKPNVDIDDYSLTLGWAFMRFPPEEALNALFKCFSETLFMCEAYPNVWVNIGPGALSAFLGSDVNFNPRVGTSWFKGSFSLDDLLNVELNPENKWWRYVIECTEKASNMCRDKAIVAFTDLLDVATSLVHLRGGASKLIKDMFHEPSKVKKVLNHLHKIWFYCFERISGVIDTDTYGFSNWATLWSKRKSFILQCDFSVYLSPKLFDEFILPLVEEECRFFERSFWHLDGPGELPHLDKFLSISELNGIQWVPGAGNPDPGESCWVPLYRRIQEAGKLLQIPGIPISKIMPILNQISPKGVFIQTSTLSFETAEDFLRKMSEKYGLT
jgi:5-methyltetrahydrofolate--homocysteine methyltransferase